MSRSSPESRQRKAPRPRPIDDPNRLPAGPRLFRGLVFVAILTAPVWFIDPKPFNTWLKGFVPEWSFPPPGKPGRSEHEPDPTGQEGQAPAQHDTEEVRRAADVRARLQALGRELATPKEAGIPALTETDITHACEAMNRWLTPEQNRADLKTVLDYIWTKHDEWERAGITNDLRSLLDETTAALGRLAFFARVSGKLPRDVSGLEDKLRRTLAESAIAFKCSGAESTLGSDHLPGFQAVGSTLMMHISALIEKHVAPSEQAPDKAAIEAGEALNRLFQAGRS